MTRRLSALASTVAVLLLVGCAADGGDEPPAPSTPVAPSVFAIDADFPDPDVVALDGEGFAAFATGGPGLNLRVAHSADLVEWTVENRDVLPRLPGWASPGRTWAPEVVAASEPGSGYVMYVTAQDTASGRQCIGVATAATIDDDFVPASDEPLVCPVEEGGAIDASTFDDLDGTRYLLWKTDGNCCAQDTWIEMAALSADGLSLTGAPIRLLRQTLDWEGALVEAPTLVHRDGRYVLLYSANDYGGDFYAVGAATAESIEGPYEKLDEPILRSAGELRGPGGQDVVSRGDADTLVFHSWDELYMYRGLVTRPIEWVDGIPRVGE
ncbi:family 43 glycosylhydrolase [Microbacterium sp. 2C]|uniref:glycoside hydrolase family 43 protein n=1 Tax=Microbacterium paulum TaxID=2707006 RepID=UPI0018C3413C|nr:glycoside hydrolase family 43 protein [Microbacterium paulum]MBG0717931.1 family 43 glycosylhydrolase [Microbacterium paulum]